MRVSKSERRRTAESGKAHREPADLESRAERLLAEYLRVWGLRDPQTIARLSSEWVARARTVASSQQSDTDLSELYRCAFGQANAEMNQWLDHLSATVCGGDARGHRGLIALELQAVLDHFPASVLDDGSPPTAMREQLASAARPVVPAASPAHMPTQSLDAISASSLLAGWRVVSNVFWGGLRALPSRETDS